MRSCIWMSLAGLIALELTGEAVANEPNAANWKTWVISSGQQFRVAPPPEQLATERELEELAKIAAAEIAPPLTVWPTGIPGRRPTAGARSRSPSI